MKTKWFVFIAIVATVTISGIIFQQATAQLRDRSERRLGGADAREGQLMETALDAFVNNAWTDLSFVLKVDDETLIKARPIHQAAYDEIQEKRQKARESDDSRAALQELAGMRETAKKSIETAETEFDTKLATVLTEEQLTKLKELRKDRREELQERREEAQERREERGNTERGGRFRR